MASRLDEDDDGAIGETDEAGALYGEAEAIDVVMFGDELGTGLDDDAAGLVPVAGDEFAWDPGLEDVAPLDPDR